MATAVAYEDGGTEVESPPVPYRANQDLSVYADKATGNTPKATIPAGTKVLVDKWHYAEYKLENGNWVQILRAHVAFKDAKGFADDGWVGYKSPDSPYRLTLDTAAMSAAAAAKQKSKPSKKKPGKSYAAPVPSNPYGGEESSAAPAALGLAAVGLLAWKLWPR